MAGAATDAGFLRTALRDGTLAAGALAFLPSWVSLERMTVAEAQPTQDLGLIVGIAMAVLAAVLWRRLAVRHGRFRTEGGCTAAFAAWVATFVLAGIAGALLMMPATGGTGAGPHFEFALWAGLLLAGVVGFATFPALVALLLLALWYGWRSRAFETSAQAR